MKLGRRGESRLGQQWPLALNASGGGRAQARPGGRRAPARSTWLGTPKIGFVEKTSAPEAAMLSGLKIQALRTRVRPIFRRISAPNFGPAAPHLRETPCRADPPPTHPKLNREHRRCDKFAPTSSKSARGRSDSVKWQVLQTVGELGPNSASSVGPMRWTAPARPCRPPLDAERGRSPPVPTWVGSRPSPREPAEPPSQEGGTTSGLSRSEYTSSSCSREAMGAGFSTEAGAAVLAPNLAEFDHKSVESARSWSTPGQLCRLRPSLGHLRGKSRAEFGFAEFGKLGQARPPPSFDAASIWPIPAQREPMY